MTKIQRIEPRPGEQSVWDYPLPPVIEDCSKRIKVISNGIVVAETARSKRVLEKGNPPVYYIPSENIRTEYLSPADNKTVCPWKGESHYYHLGIGENQIRYACWYYPNPKPEFEQIKNYIAFYAQKMDACYIDDELVTPQPGKYYGGWITKGIIGPFKGEEGV